MLQINSKVQGAMSRILSFPTSDLKISCKRDDEKVPMACRQHIARFDDMFLFVSAVVSLIPTIVLHSVAYSFSVA